MTTRFTSSHWGSYTLVGQGASAHLMPVEGDPSPSLIGRGWLDAVQNADTRIARPSIREGWLKGRDKERSGDARFVEVPWDEALDLTSDELKRVIAQHGNGSIFAGSYGWASAGRFHHAQSQLRRFLNGVGGYVSSANTYSHAAAEVLLPHIVGQSNKVFQDSMTSWPLVAQQCELFVAFGGVSGRTAQITSSGTSTHEVENWMERAVARGMKVVNISPLSSDVAEGLDAQWLDVRPGTDTALILALAHELFVTGKADRDFLARYTHGAEVFETTVMGTLDGTPKTPEWAAEICAVAPEVIRELAARMASSKTMIAMTWSMQRMDHGEQPIWAGLALAAMLGQIGQPGTGYGFGYGSTTPVGRPKKLIGWPSLPQGQNPVKDFIPVARITDAIVSHGDAYPFDGTMRHYPDIRMIWWSGGNPFHHHQDLVRLDNAWRRPKTVVVLDHSWTATARRADIVLPTTSPLERDDIMMNRRDPALIYMSAAIPVYEEARDDYAIMTGLAQRMGTADEFTQGRSVDDWLAWLWSEAGTVASGEGFTLPDFEIFKAEGWFDTPDDERLSNLLGDFIDDPQGSPLATRSGKIELFSASIDEAKLDDCPPSPQWLEPAEWLGNAKPVELHLVSGQPNTRLHAQCDSGSVSKASKIKGREACVLHPQTAAQYGLAAGDIALLENDRGACLSGVTLSEGMRADCVSLPTGAWLDLQAIDGRLICVHGNPNVLTIDKGTSGLAQGNIAHTTLVRISKWDRELPALKVHSQPEFVSA